LNFRYDGLGQLIGEMQNQYRIQHRYNAPGQKTHTIMPNGRTVRYDYDERGLVNRISYSGRVLSKVSYDTFGQETQRSTGEVSSRMEYDAMGRLLNQRAENGHGRLLDRTYRYDKAGNLRQIDDGTGGRLKLHYDALDRLQKVESSLSGIGDEQFTFDPAGNLLDSQYPEPEGFVQGNRLRVFQNYRFEYDDVGNLVRQFQGRMETRFYYNVANQLVRAHKHDQTIEFAYDPLGRRIKKQSDQGQIIYVWDGDRLIGEQPHTGHNEEQNDDGLITYLYEPDRPKPLCQIREGEAYYFHTDQQGTPLIITTMDGKKVWQARFKAYGSITQLQADNIVNPICFHSYYHDVETGLLYGRQRYYHPVIGRFVQQGQLCAQNRSNNYLYSAALTTSPDLVVPNGLKAEPVNYINYASGSTIETRLAASITSPGQTPDPKTYQQHLEKSTITPQSMAPTLSAFELIPKHSF
jgi:RHS repeat-associated protein